MNTSTKTRILVEGAAMIAIATILSYLKLLEMPFGGSITLEMIPIVIMGYRNGAKWGCLTGFVHGLLQMILGFSNVMYCPTLASQIGCILLDYLFAFSVLGLGPVAFKLCKNNLIASVITGSFICCALRFVCSFLSGWIIWGAYMPEEFTNPAVYSLIYNGAYMLPDTIIVVIVMALLAKTAPKLLNSEQL